MTKNNQNSSSSQYSGSPTLQHAVSPVAVIGLWHQGIVAAACLADFGYDVVAADVDAAKIKTLCDGRAPLYEPGLDELIRKGLDAGKLRFTTDLAAAAKGCADVLVMHDTPVDANDQSDLSVVFRDVEAIAPGLAEGCVMLVTAQVPVGTCDKLAAAVRAKRPGLKFGLAYSPENLRLGQAIERFRKPALPVIGSDDAWALDRVEQLLAPCGVKWERVNLRTAEMAKHALNAFLATSVTFANELGNLCDEVGADGVRLAQVLRLEPRIGPKAMLMPGLGFSGGTLARDMQTLRGLGDRFGIETRMLDGIWESNKRQNELVVRKLKKMLGALKGVPVAVFGLTYKPDTSTLRRSASLEIIAEIVREGAVVAAHDPKADRGELASHREFRFVDDVYEAARGAQAVVIITGWAEYRKLDAAKLKQVMARPVVIDTNNMLDAAAMEQAGFVYLDIGRGRGAGKREV